MEIKELLKTQKVQIVCTAADLREVFLGWLAEHEAKKLEKQEDKMLAIDEVLQILQVTKPTLWRWNKSGYLPSVKVGKKIFYREADLKKLMEG